MQMCSSSKMFANTSDKFVACQVTGSLRILSLLGCECSAQYKERQSEMTTYDLDRVRQLHMRAKYTLPEQLGIGECLCYMYSK